MGCDIHLHCEAKFTVQRQIWRCVDHFSIDHYDGGFSIVPVYSKRDYALFSALADVRSYGCEVESFDVRGLPYDVSTQVKEYSEEWGIDGHSHSWLTLQELYDYVDRNHSFRYRGMISPSQAVLLDRGGIVPDSWCGWTSDDSYVHREWEVQECPIPTDFIEALEKRAKDVLWEFGDERVPPEKAEKFRIVFWFDS